ncbi:uncharacterized protein LOC127263870 isoform X2 [Andrographis paniculata]|uniref:uncharacterized protein LOC127263870 isoform X2 n=1 Tax=Andrographis paniculata TaxID=175694 RepID=UPI0021E728EB|nr:uncharacterized protein LOC127263870 isoform X2 [Andrographis paniculata]
MMHNQFPPPPPSPAAAAAADQRRYGEESTGYLEDVLWEYFSSKRRRLLMPDQSEIHTSPNNLEKWWRASEVEECSSSSRLTTRSTTAVSVSSSLITNNNNNNNNQDSSKSTTPEEEGIWEGTTTAIHTKTLQMQKPNPNPPCIIRSDIKKESKKKMLAKVAYPFAMVKPGGCEGDLTLNDINERILMPPTRPVRHPVGDYAFRPMISPEGPGLSGKAVVAFTRIHTQGRRGTITIIRTRG